MPKLVCPECGEQFVLAPEEVLLYSTVECEECGTTLEVASENPLVLAAVGPAFGDDDFEEDDDEDDDV